MKNIINAFQGIHTNATIWIWFLPAASFTFLFSYKMVRYAEVLIYKTKFGGAFVGGVIISIATSLTELVTAITQGITGQPEVGLANSIGANYFSTFMIAVVSIIFIKQLFMKKLDWWTITTICISLILTIIFTIVIANGQDYGIGIKQKFYIGTIPFIFLISYIFYIQFSYKFNIEDKKIQQKLITHSVKTGMLGFILFSILLLISALFLNVVVDAMKIHYSLSSESAGGILLSMNTAMPEIVSLIILTYRKQPITAISSIIGSHIFNLSLIFYGDMAFIDDSIISSQSVINSDIWKMGISTIVLIFMLLIFVIIIKKIKNKYIYAIMPLLIILLYISGWLWMLLT